MSIDGPEIARMIPITANGAHQPMSMTLVNMRPRNVARLPRATPSAATVPTSNFFWSGVFAGGAVGGFERSAVATEAAAVLRVAWDAASAAAARLATCS